MRHFSSIYLENSLFGSQNFVAQDIILRELTFETKYWTFLHMGMLNFNY